MRCCRVSGLSTKGSEMPTSREVSSLSGFSMTTSAGPLKLSVPRLQRAGTGVSAMSEKWRVTQAAASSGLKSPVTTTVMLRGT